MTNKEVIKFLLEDLSNMCSDDEKVRRPYYEQAISALKIDCEACVYKDYFDDDAGILGHWIDKGSLSCRCNQCGCKANNEYSFCPNCGAYMRGDENA